MSRLQQSGPTGNSTDLNARRGATPAELVVPDITTQTASNQVAGTTGGSQATVPGVHEVNARPPKPDMPVSWEWIDRADCDRLWTLVSHRQRPLDKRRADAYIRDMNGGLWAINADTIVFSKSGQIINGQHRIHALKYSGLPGFWAIVVRNADEDMFDVIDGGRKRTIIDTLNPTDYYSPKDIAAAIVLIQRYEQRGKNRKLRPAAYATVAAKHKDIKNYPRLNELSRLVSGTKLICKYDGVLLAGLYLTDARDPIQAEAFLTAVKTGANLAVGDPRLALCRTLPIIAQAKQPYLKERKPEACFILYLQAWNRWRAGDSWTDAQASHVKVVFSLDKDLA